MKNEKNMGELKGFSRNSRVFFFDLDGTLAELAKPVKPSTIALLHKLERHGRIALSSGKPLYYLSGFARQLDLEEPILMGENGTLIQFGINLPPSLVLKADFPASDEEALNSLKAIIKEEFPSIWFQPNEICLTPFPTKKEEWERIQALADSPLCADLQVYRHGDSFDFLPRGIDKGVGVRLLASYLGITDEKNLYAFGDAANDIALFKACGHSFGLKGEARKFAEFTFDDIDSAIAYALNLFE